MDIEKRTSGEGPMKLEERVVDEDRVEYGVGNGLYVLCVRDPRSGKIIVGRVQTEVTGERADEVLRRTKLPVDYIDQIKSAAEAHFYPAQQEAA